MKRVDKRVTIKPPYCKLILLRGLYIIFFYGHSWHGNLLSVFFILILIFFFREKVRRKSNSFLIVNHVHIIFIRII